MRHRVQTGTGAHPDSYAVGIRAFSLADKAAGAWHWSLTSI